MNERGSESAKKSGREKENVSGRSESAKEKERGWSAKRRGKERENEKRRGRERRKEKEERQKNWPKKRNVLLYKKKLQ